MFNYNENKGQIIIACLEKKDNVFCVYIDRIAALAD